MITLLVGSTGAGKTTYGHKLASELPAVLYSIDNWMRDLWGPDMPEDPSSQWFHENHGWYIERIARCEKKILDLATTRSRLGQHSILDLGFTTSEHRRRMIAEIKSLGADSEMLWLDVPCEERWDRVKKRNMEKGETFVMTVDRSMFDYMESIFEKPSSEEGCQLIRC